MSKDCLKARAIAAAENDELAADWRKEPAQYAPVIRELVARVAELERQHARIAELVAKAQVVAYLDVGIGGYIDLGSELKDEQLSALPNGRHSLAIAGTYGIDGYVASAPSPAAPAPDARDAERLMFVMGDIDGFEGVPDDKYGYAADCAAENGRDEPSAQDELNGARMLIDAAIAAQAKQGEQQ